MTGDIEQAVLASGALRPVKLVALGAQVDGRLTSMKVKVGHAVKQGDPVAEIDSTGQQNAVKTAQAFLSSSHAQLQEKQATLAYTESALAHEVMTLAAKATSRDTYETTDTLVKTTLAQIACLTRKLLKPRLR